MVSHPIRILWSSKGGFEVFPSVFVASPGDACDVRNLTDYDALVTVPAPVVQEGARVPVAAHGAASFAITGGSPGIYEYSVELDARGLTFRARGGSDPRIIID